MSGGGTRGGSPWSRKRTGLCAAAMTEVEFRAECNAQAAAFASCFRVVRGLLPCRSTPS